jgi:preprotein translocase subunit SecB
MKMNDIVQNKNMPDIKSNPLVLEVSPKVELKRVMQIKGTFNQKPTANAGLKSVDIDNLTRVKVDKENLLIFVFVDFKLAAKLEKEPDPVVNVDASFLLVYELIDLEGLTDEHFRQFANVNGLFNAWPYWREYVQSATIRMGLPALTIPVFCLYKPQKKQSVTTESITKE